MSDDSITANAEFGKVAPAEAASPAGSRVAGSVSLVVIDIAELERMVRAAVRTELEAFAPQVAAPSGLRTKAQIALELGKSLPSIDRFVRAGMPHEIVGTTKRFDLAKVREWLAARGAKPTTLVATPRPDAETEKLLERRGLQLVGRRVAR